MKCKWEIPGLPSNRYMIAVSVALKQWCEGSLFLIKEACP